jgi:hypothetical protein
MRIEVFGTMAWFGLGVYGITCMSRAGTDYAIAVCISQMRVDGRRFLLA